MVIFNEQKSMTTKSASLFTMMISIPEVAILSAETSFNIYHVDTVLKRQATIFHLF